LHPALLVTIKDLVARLSGDAILPAQICHWLAGEPRTLPSHPSPNTPSTASTSSLKKGESVTYVSGTFCHLCVGSLIP
jgi:hypothetical protein